MGLACFLRDEFGLLEECNNRGDVLLDGRKISGSAHQVARGGAYSHFTVLVDSNFDALCEVLRAPGRNASMRAALRQLVF